MARSFANTKLAISALIDGASVTINRSRGFASVASQSVGSRGVVVKITGEEKRPSSGATKEVSPWIPDPVTGYYRPENRATEVDVAELRDVLLNHK